MGTPRASDHPPLRVGLTGGIASGKSTVAELFAALGVPVIDTDVIARELSAPGGAAIPAIVAAFGAAALDEHGALDRAAMRRRVFADSEARRTLEAILHPAILEEVARRSGHIGGTYQLIVVPLLVEAGLEQQFDRVLVVDCPPELQLERLRARDAETAEQAQRMLDAQSGRAARLARADDVIINDGSLAELAAEVRKLHERYRREALAYVDTQECKK